jgi:quercetin 2,3-dioxygenase
MKKLLFIHTNAQRHWVGDGFPVRSIFSYNDLSQELSPFLLMDYGGPTSFPPTERRLGVGGHPHRGFETVTIVYDGQVEHRDSSGGGGVISKGDVQWMTAGSGLVHEEFHGSDYAKKGGPFEMVQLWVNLPRKDKWVSPGYQGLSSEIIPRVELPDGAGHVRVIAGTYNETKGPAHTFSPLNLWDVRVNGGSRAEFKVPEGYTTALFVMKGRIKLPAGETVKEAELAVLDKKGELFAFEAVENTTLLVLNGEPIDEPVVGYGPFVMNSEAEIRQAMVDYNTGKMGTLTQR